MNFNEIMEDFDNKQGSNSIMYQNRPYKGQAHTVLGARGKTEINGITFRDLHDAFIKSAFDSSYILLTDELKEKHKKDKLTPNDIYLLNLNEIDPIAWQQNLSIRIEKMMGIFPNVTIINEKENDCE
jgi:hypothetical protein